MKKNLKKTDMFTHLWSAYAPTNTKKGATSAVVSQ